MTWCLSWTHRGVAAVRKGLVAAALLPIVALAGCSSGSSKGVPVSANSAPVTASPTPPGRSAEWGDSLRTVDMVDAHTAWAYAPGVAYRTTDGGAHWIASRYHDADSGTTLTMAAMALDLDHAWLAEWQEGSALLTVYATADGGHTWFPSNVATTIGVGRVDIDFVNATDGWLLVSGSPSVGLMPKAIYHTGNGGHTWDLVACGCAEKDVAAVPWLGGGMYTTGMAFRDGKDGWVTGTYHGVDSIPIYRTADGGKTWALQKLSLPTSLQGATYGDGAQPIFFGQGRQNGILPVSLRMGDKFTILPFTTKDGGQTWAPNGAVQVSHGVADSEIKAVDADHFWVWEKNGSLYRTQDAGKTWQTLASDWKLVDLSFGSATEGLGLARDGEHQVLVRSSNGGQAWAPVQAEITPPAP
jgi:photosystem II stability/assembly factor-like uncharacterized protein